jgi:glycosyltransferase involved in cell wall biosynthesis
MIPTLSILIPTRNRPKELTSLVSIIKKCQTNRIEFIVSDNSDKVDIELAARNEAFKREYARVRLATNMGLKNKMNIIHGFNRDLEKVKAALSGSI